MIELPFDIIAFIARYLPPYDIAALSSTCRAFRVIMFDKSLWLHIVETISRTRPAPFSPYTFANLSVDELHHFAHRCQRITERWSPLPAAPVDPSVNSSSGTSGAVPPSPVERQVIPSTHNPAKIITFNDQRTIRYFAFLPGGKNIIVFDERNCLSCWNTDGVRLATYDTGFGSQLARWRPSEEIFDEPHGPGTQLIEILIDDHTTGWSIQGRLAPINTVHLYFTPDAASFGKIRTFSIPPNLAPASALLHTDMRGMTVSLSGRGTNRQHLGIYLVNNQGRAVCIDTGLPEHRNTQSLLSSSFMVLYREDSDGAHIHAYDTSTLRRMIQRYGVDTTSPYDQSPLSIDVDQQRRERLIASAEPITVPPSHSSIVPFQNVSRRLVPSTSINQPCAASSRKGKERQLDDMPEAVYELLEEAYDMRWNTELYPIVIPKWHVLDRDSVFRASQASDHPDYVATTESSHCGELNAHRTRSIITISTKVEADPDSDSSDESMEHFAQFGPFNETQPPSMHDLALSAINSFPGVFPMSLGNFMVGNNMVSISDGQGEAQNSQAPLNPQLSHNANLNNEHMLSYNHPAVASSLDPLSSDSSDISDSSSSSSSATSTSQRETVITHHYFSYTAHEDTMKREVIASVRLAKLARLRQRNLTTGPLTDWIGVNQPRGQLDHGIQVRRLWQYENEDVSRSEDIPRSKDKDEGQMRRATANPNDDIGALLANMADLINAPTGSNSHTTHLTSNGSPQPLQPSSSAPSNPNPAASPQHFDQLSVQLDSIGFGHVAPDLAFSEWNNSTEIEMDEHGFPNFDIDLNFPFEHTVHFAMDVDGNGGDHEIDLLEALALNGQDPDDGGSYQGNPVLGYGGKCAMWIEQGDNTSFKKEDGDVRTDQKKRSQDNSRRLRLVTFPSYKPDHELPMTSPNRYSRTINPAMATPFTPRYDAPICTLMVPSSLDLQKVTCMDLDDTRGIVGLATTRGELWLIDYS